MKKFKLLLAAFVATLFAFVGGNAFADGATYSLTIKGTHVGHTYEAYQIFAGDISSDEKTLSNVKQGSDVTPFDYKGITEADKIAEEISKPGKVDENNETKAAKDFSKLAGAHLTTTPHKVTSTETTTVIFGLAPGYYLVKDVDGSQTADPSKESEKATAYTRFIMQVVGNSEAQLKNKVPTVEKKVKENSNSEWQDAADYDMGDTVPFQLTAELPKKRVDDYNHYYVEFTDTGKTPKDTVKVFTYQTIINKVDQDGKALSGAEFTLVKKNKDGSTKNVDVVKNAEGKSFTFKSLDAGNYVLEETKTPDGYNTNKAIEFTIDADYDKEADDPQLTKLSGDVNSGVAKFDANKADSSLKADIVNRKGSLLPSTGGMGTTILYVVGSILVLVAAILLITKKRMDAAK